MNIEKEYCDDRFFITTYAGETGQVNLMCKMGFSVGAAVKTIDGWETTIQSHMYQSSSDDVVKVGCFSERKDAEKALWFNRGLTYQIRILARKELLALVA